MLFKLAIILIIPFFAIALLLRMHRFFHWNWLEKILLKVDLADNMRRKRYVPIIEMLFIPVILVMAFLSFRHIKPDKPRFDNRIAVIADSTDWNRFELLLRSSFEQVLRTPQPEKYFNLFHTSKIAISQVAAFQYVLILTSNFGQGSISKSLESDFDLNPHNENNFCRIFFQPTIRNQIVVAYCAENSDSLETLLRQESPDIYREIERDAKNCKRGELFTSRHENKTARELLEKYGWAFTKQADMKVIEELPEGGFVAFSPWSPGRYLFVHWVENGDTSFLSPEWMLKTRNTICKAHYDSIYVDSHYLNFSRTDFLGRKALVTHGLWVDDNPSIGGPFINFTFYNPGDRRVYMIDTFVFRPGQEKLPFLLPLEVMAHTFISAVD